MKRFKKLISLTLVMIMIFSILSIAPFTVNAAGDSISAATPYTIGNTIYGSITSTSTKDFYKFNLPSSGRITLIVNAYIARSYYNIYDANGNTIWSSGDRDWNDTTEKLSLNEIIDLTSGTYYLSIDEWYHTGNYNFKILFTSAGESFKESGYGNNNNISSAISISLNTTYKGQIAENDDKDFYKFNLSSSGRITLSANAYIARSYYNIYDTNGNNVWDSGDRDWNSTTEKLALNEIIDLTSGTYYLSIDEWYHTGNYDFKISFTSASESFKETGFGTNNNISVANSISLNTTYQGQIAVNDDKDFYKFSLTSSGTINLTVNAYLDRTNYYFYDASGNEVWCRDYQYWDSNNKKLNLSESIYLSAGTYYLCVEEWAYTGNYSFKISKYVTQLATPKISKFEAVSNGMNLKWNAISGAEKYGVYRKTEFDNSWKNIGITSGTSFTDKNAIAGNTYIYTLCCISADEKTITSSYDATGQKIKYATTPKLNTPTYVKDGVKISWSGSSNAVSYRVLCKYSGSNGWKTVGDTTSTSFTHKTGKTNRVYTYTVRCTTKSGKSYVSYFDTKGVTKTFKKLATPKISKFEGVSNGIKLKWSSVSGAEKYCVFRKTDSNTDWKSVGITSGLSYTDKTAKAGKTYTYTLCCVSSDGKNITSSYDATGQRIKYATTPKLKNPAYVKGGVKISWNKSDNAVSYRVFCKYSGSGGWKKVGDTTSTSFTHKTGKKGRVYTYTVRCTTKSGKSYVSYFDSKGVSKKFKK